MSCLAPSTQKNYIKAVESFKKFLLEYYYILWEQATKEHVEAYVVHLHHDRKLATSSIRSKLSAIEFFAQGQLKIELTKSFIIDKLLKKYTKEAPLPSLQRLPIQKNLLKQLLAHVSKTYSHQFYRHMFFVLYSIMYKLALRISEVVNYKPQTFNHAITLKNFQLRKENKEVKIIIATGKHSSEPATYILTCNATLWRHIRQFLDLRGKKEGPLFIHPTGVPLNRQFVVKNLKRDLEVIGLDPKKYNSHSFRSGKATDLFDNNEPTDRIKQVGRWKSDAHHKYIKPKYIKV